MASLASNVMRGLVIWWSRVLGSDCVLGIRVADLDSIGPTLGSNNKTPDESDDDWLDRSL